jgi:hypothetical protein
MTRCTLALAFVLASTACAPAVRFSATALPVGTFETVADQCHAAETSYDGVVYTGLELTSGSQLGTMVFVGRERSGPSILATEGRRLAVVWRVVGTEGPPAVFIPAEECEVFRLTTDTSARLGGATAADFEIRCAWSEGQRFVGVGRFTEVCP